jgi:hypothetical protein
VDEPCNWPTGECPAPDGVTPEQLEAAEEEAIWTLWVLTGQRFGQCEETIASPPVCLCRTACTCMRCYIYLPGPAGPVSEVTERGVVITDYEQQGPKLWRPFGWLWPDQLTVTYLRGIPVPAGGARAVGELAYQLALLACRSPKCQLPPNWESRTRQGDTIRARPVDNQSQTSLTGLPLVDRWIQTARRYTTRERVWSPDVPGWLRLSGPTPPSS